jgi:hypothetical protein
MKTWLVGDTHGGRCINPSWMSHGSIQLGDMCLGNYGSYRKWRWPAGTVRAFIDGNHDWFPMLNPNAPSPVEVAPGLLYVPRGFVSGRVMMIGGAESHDKYLRTPGYDWFPEESITQNQFMRIMDYAGPVEVILSHTCPNTVAWHMGFHSSPPSELALDAILEKFKPALWVFGHCHIPFDETIDGTRFVCIPNNQRLEFDIPLGDLFPAV